MMKENDRGSWYLLTGLVLGVIIGLVYAWYLRPVQYVDTTPSGLSPSYKDNQRALVASAYMATSNLERARARLKLLEDPDPYTVISEQARRALVDGSSPNEARALGMLSVALGQENGPTPAQPGSPQASTTSEASGVDSVPTQTRPAPTLTPSLTATLGEPQASALAGSERSATEPAGTQSSTLRPSVTPFPTRTTTPTPGGPFTLKEMNEICEPTLTSPMLQVMAINVAGEPQAGVQVIVTWDGGEQHFYTGLKPEVSPGYADFQMAPGTVYSLRLAGGGEPVNTLRALDCDGSWGTWELVFERP